MLKTILSLLFLSFLFSAIALTQETRIVYVSKPAANIRSGPGMDFKTVGVVKQGSALKVISEKEGWYEILAGDTLDGWIAVQFTSDEPMSQAESLSQKYLEGDLNVKLEMIRTLARQPSEKGSSFLQDIIVNHLKYDSGIQNDKVILSELFKCWAEAGVTSGVSSLVFVMENELGGEIGSSAEAMAEIRIHAKEALKVLVRKK